MLDHADDGEDYAEGDVPLADMDPVALQAVADVLGVDGVDPADPVAALRVLYGDDLVVL